MCHTTLPRCEFVNVGDVNDLFKIFLFIWGNEIVTALKRSGKLHFFKATFL